MARTVETPITYTWKCSRCGKVNLVSTLIKVKKKKPSRGRRDASVPTGTDASGIPEDLFGKRGHYAVYRTLGLNHACKWCGYKEGWAAPNLNWINNLFLFLFCVFLFLPAAGALILGIVSLFEGDLGSFPSFVWPILLLFLLASAVDKAEDRYVRKKDLLMSNLPVTAFPTLVIDGRPVANADEFSEDHSVNRPPEHTPQGFAEGTRKAASADNSNSFCSNCGALITEDSAKFCSNCGHSLQQH